MRRKPGKRSASKGRKKKASKAARGKAVKARTKKKSRSAAKPKKAAGKHAGSATKRTSARKIPRKSPRKSNLSEVLGEGNYTASRDFREAETRFVKRNRKRIPAMGQEAEAALKGHERAALESVEDMARAHSHSPGDER